MILYRFQRKRRALGAGRDSSLREQLRLLDFHPHTAAHLSASARTVSPTAMGGGRSRNALVVVYSPRSTQSWCGRWCEKSSYICC